MGLGGISIWQLLLAVLAILNLILFFKVWGMTKNTRRIRELFELQSPDFFWNGYVYKERKETKK